MLAYLLHVTGEQEWQFPWDHDWAAVGTQNARFCHNYQDCVDISFRAQTIHRETSNDRHDVAQVAVVWAKSLDGGIDCRIVSFFSVIVFLLLCNERQCIGVATRPADEPRG